MSLRTLRRQRQERRDSELAKHIARGVAAELRRAVPKGEVLEIKGYNGDLIIRALKRRGGAA